MTPTHTNKQGARYRYYISHSTLQRRARGASKVIRVNAADLEAIVIKAIHDHLIENGTSTPAGPVSDGEIIEQYLEGIVVKHQTLEIYLIDDAKRLGDGKNEGPATRDTVRGVAGRSIILPWAMATTATKGVVNAPFSKPSASQRERDAVLIAIAKARAWISDLVEGRAGSFAEIAKREGKVERHIRLLAPLAFVSPKIVTNVVYDYSRPRGTTDLAKALAYSWSRQALDLAEKR
jgi:site-specific DNA recombinase